MSANGTSNGLSGRWRTTPAATPEESSGSNPADAARLRRHQSGQRAVQQQPGAGARDQFGLGNKFITPVIVNGKVFVGTPNGVAEFGLLQ